MSNRRQRKLTKNKTVDEMMARFEHGYDTALPQFIKFERLQQAYDNYIDSASWPTISEIGFPVAYTSVEEQLPLAMKYLFPKNRFINLTPSAMMEPSAVQRIENDLRYTIRTKMSAEVATLPSIKDCFKLGVGYGLIDTVTITPPAVRNNILAQGSNVIQKIPQMSLGKPVKVPVYKYISPSNVIPMPGGANVDGPNSAAHFVIDIKTEAEFRSLYEEKDSEGNPYFKGSPDDIVKEARHLNFDSRAIDVDLIYKVAGYDLAATNQSDRKIPVSIPIVKCYFPHQEVWIANGTTLIWEVKDKYQTLMSDLIKWSASPDGDRWYPMSMSEASERLNAGINVWYNGMIDLSMYMMNPTRVINSDKIDHPDDVARGPRSDIKVRGNVQDAVSYLDLPSFPNQLFDMGGVIERFHGNANATQRSVKDGQAGLVRGGTNALEALMSSSTGRQFLAAIVLKTGALKPLVEKTLIKKQLLVDQSGESFIERDVDPDTGALIFNKNSVTLEEYRNVFQVELDMPEARINSGASMAERQGFFDRAKQDPTLFDKRKLYELLSEDDQLVRRVMLPENVVKEREARLAEANMAAAERGEQTAGGGAIAPTDSGVAGPPQTGGQL